MNETEFQSPRETTAAPETSAPRPQAYTPALPARGINDPRRKSPILAGLLSLVPGLGQVYVGYYARGFVHAAVVGSIISILASRAFTDRGPIPLFALFMVFFWLYNVIDAARKASLVNLALEGIGTLELPEDFPTPGLRGSIMAGLLMIGGGVIFLSNTLFDISLEWLGDWWPVAPIIFGVYLLGRGLFDRLK